MEIVDERRQFDSVLTPASRDGSLRTTGFVKSWKKWQGLAGHYSVLRIVSDESSGTPLGFVRVSRD